VAGHDWGCLGLAAPLTVTIGLSSHLGGADDDGADFLRLADMALLAAKEMARDMVLHADALPSRCPASAGI
jgi:GGDEF domain-containing protein